MPQLLPSLEYELNQQPLSFVLRSPSTIGRSADCSIVLPETISGVSRKHATIEMQDGGWYLCDNNSTNGTYLNGVRMTRQRLRDGDGIRIGHLNLTFRAPDDDMSALGFDFDDDLDENVAAPRGSIFINMDDVGRILANLAGSGVRQAPGPVITRLGDSSSELRSLSGNGFNPDASGVADSASDGHNGFSWAIDLFTQVGRSLIAASSLHEMLEGILELAFANVPAERGMICSYEEATGQITPRMFRSSGADVRGRLHVSRSVVNHAIQARGGLLVADAKFDDRFAAAQSIRALSIKSAMCVPLIAEGKITGLVYVDTQRPDQLFGERHLEILTALALYSAVALEQARLRDVVQREQLIRNKLARYHSPAVIEQICRDAVSGNSGQLMTEEREVTVMFSDLSGFTALSERITASEVVGVLNGVFALLAAAVFEYGGTLDKFMGDGMLAFFGAPLAQPDHQERAVRTALRMKQSLAEFNAQQPADLQIAMRIGINSGMAIVGEMGSPDRCDYTVIGDTVNLASRLESSVARAGEIVLGPSLGKALQNRFLLKRLPEVRVKGKQHPLEPWLVLTQPDPSVIDPEPTGLPRSA